MTIKNRLECCISAKSDGYLFVNNPYVAIISSIFEFTGNEFCAQDFFEGAIERYLSALSQWSQAYPAFHLYLFVASPDWIYPNTIDKKLGIWRDQSFKWVQSDGKYPKFHEFLKEKQSRFASVLEINADQFQFAAKHVQYSRSSYIFLSRKSPDDILLDITPLFDATFPGDHSDINWTTLINYSTQARDLLLKFHGGFDDQEIAIDTFMIKEDFLLFKSFQGK